jgi:hypothetical protein
VIHDLPIVATTASGKTASGKIGGRMNNAMSNDLDCLSRVAD